MIRPMGSSIVCMILGTHIETHFRAHDLMRACLLSAHTCQLKKEGMRICNPTQHQQHTMQEREEEEEEKFPFGSNSYYYFSLSSIRVATGAMNLLTV